MSGGASPGLQVFLIDYVCDDVHDAAIVAAESLDNARELLAGITGWLGYDGEPTIARIVTLQRLSYIELPNGMVLAAPRSV